MLPTIYSAFSALQVKLSIFSTLENNTYIEILLKRFIQISTIAPRLFDKNRYRSVLRSQPGLVLDSYRNENAARKLLNSDNIVYTGSQVDSYNI